MSDAKQNTDRELWREHDGDYHAGSLHVTEGGGIGINCGGHVIVKPIRAWHGLARELVEAKRITEETMEALRYIWLDSKDYDAGPCVRIAKLAQYAIDGNE